MAWRRYRRIGELRRIGTYAILIKREQFLMAGNRRGILRPRGKMGSPAYAAVALDLENLNQAPEPGGEVGSR